MADFLDFITCIDIKYFEALSTFLMVIGAWFIAYEVVNQYKGKEYGGLNWSNDDGCTEKTPEFKRWSQNKKFWMWAGLLLVTIGGFLDMYLVLIQKS